MKVTKRAVVKGRRVLRDLRDHFGSVLQDIRFFEPEARLPRLLAAWTVARDRWVLPTLCHIDGHNWEGSASAESGREDLWCRRCGMAMHFWF